MSYRFCFDMIRWYSLAKSDITLCNLYQYSFQYVFNKMRSPKFTSMRGDLSELTTSLHSSCSLIHENNPVKLVETPFVSVVPNLNII